MLFKQRSLLLLLPCILITGWPAYMQAGQYHCEAQPVIISAPNDHMKDHICNASERTLAFLKQYNLSPQRTIRIEVVEQSLNINGYMAIGSYDRKSDLIRIMSLSAILQISDTPKMYNMLFDEEHYIGSIAHEITHAVFQHNAVDVEDKWNNAAQEYLAHATQLGVLPATVREDIISSENTAAWESGDEISVTYMGFNTTGFAVKSYLHLTQLPDPLPFIKLLMNHKWLYVSVP